MHAMHSMEASTVPGYSFVNEFVARFGAPDYVHTDQGFDLAQRSV